MSRARPRRRRHAAAGLATGPVLLMLATAGLLLFLLPLLALAVRAPWTQLPRLLAGAAALTALRLSLLTSAAAVAGSLLVGLPLAWVLARVEFRGRALLRSLVLLPMVLPPVVAGIALLAAFGRAGLLGSLLARVGISLPFTAAGTALAQAFVAAPFLVVALESGFAGVDRRLEDAAASLGGSRWLIWRTVVLPAVRPSLLAGVALCWARALGEFGATITFAGSLRGRTETLPLAVYRQLQVDPSGAVAVSVLLLAVSLVLIVGLRARLSLPRLGS